MPTPPVKRASQPVLPTATTEYTDSYGITYIGGVATVRVGIDVKPSRNYQSCGVHGSLEFTSKASDVDANIGRAFDKLRAALKPQIEQASNLLNEL